MNASEQLRREVYGVFGVPIDAVDMTTVLRSVGKAVSSTSPFLIWTVNLNFLISSQSDDKFRESLLLSDLCTADGMPVVWLSQLIGAPLRQRIAGADIFDQLRKVNIIGR